MAAMAHSRNRVDCDSRCSDCGAALDAGKRHDTAPVRAETDHHRYSSLHANGPDPESSEQGEGQQGIDRCGGRTSTDFQTAIAAGARKKDSGFRTVASAAGRE